jgi:hypothetical protein
MTSSLQKAPDSIAASYDSQRTEAARYALLRRLAPSIRHHLVVNLQPIGMVYEVLDRRLRAPEPDLAEVHNNAQKINGFARAALDSSLDVVTWLAPDPNVASSVANGVRECLSLIATSLSFRGYSLRNDVAPVGGEVRRSAIRTMLTAAIMHITDHNPPPANLVLAAQPERDSLVLSLTLLRTDGDGGFTAEMPYRKIEWADLQALAAAESVQLSSEGSQKLRLAIPWIVAA